MCGRDEAVLVIDLCRIKLLVSVLLLVAKTENEFGSLKVFNITEPIYLFIFFTVPGRFNCLAC